MPIGAAIGAVGSIAGGAIGGKGAKKAADAQTQAAERQAQVQEQLGNRSMDIQVWTIDEAQRKSFPWYATGQAALARYADAMGIARPAELDTEIRSLGAQQANTLLPSGIKDQSGFRTAAQGGYNALTTGYLANWRRGPNGEWISSSGDTTLPDEWLRNYAAQQSGQATGNALAPAGEQIPVVTEGSLPIPKDPSQLTLADFEASPDYQFRVDEGTKGIENALAARGMRLSGGALKELDRFNSNLASGEYGGFYNRKSAERNNYLAQLANLSGMGQANVQQANALGQSAAGNIASINSSMASNMGNALQAGGAARASGYQGQANAWQNALLGVGQSVGNWLGGSGAPSGGPMFSGQSSYYPNSGTMVNWLA